MKEEPFFSLVIANYNNGCYLEQSISSIIEQTFGDFELIVIDDGSTDHSGDIIRRWGLTDPRIRAYFFRTNHGVGHAKHTGVLKSRGKYAGFIDPDDAIPAHALHTFYKAITENPGHILYYSTHYICDEMLRIKQVSNRIGQIPAADTFLSLAPNYSNQISQLALFSRSAYMKTGGINVRFKKAADKDLYYKLEEQGSILYIDEPLLFYRQHKTGISQNDQKSEARLWEVRAMKNAYRRRKDSIHIKNTTRTRLSQEFNRTYGTLMLESAKQRDWRRFFRLVISFMLDTTDRPAFPKTVYYSFMKAKYPDKYLSNDPGQHNNSVL